MSYDLTQLETVMLERGYTLSALAKRARMPVSTLREIFLRGSGHPKNVKKIANALGRELHEIVIPPDQRKKAV